MIKYLLKCNNDHEFESWFSNSEEFERLNKRKLLECIFCLSKKIKKSIMAPMIFNTKNTEKKFDIIDKDCKDRKNKLLQIRKFIEKNFDYVGEDFSKKVREVHYDKKNNKAIYGTTSIEERKELAEEGIDLFSIPWINKDN
jgi:hypothetical protein|tara:strand:+ start:520 stop:942 length:423 start_codon:yes stop_codon:yes gene_type:complete